MEQHAKQQNLEGEGDRKLATAIGIGCKKGCSAEAIIALVQRAMVEVSCGGAPSALFTHEAKKGEAGLRHAAEALGLPLVFLDAEALGRASPRTATSSQRVLDLYGLPSIAEAAALAGAGPSSVLIVARLNNGEASCALACNIAANKMP
jgi:cobalt-precorrin 5A hydrolase